MVSESVEQARELVNALSRFCRTVETITASETEVSDPRVLALTQLVQESADVLDQLLADRTPVDRSRGANIASRSGL